MKGFIRVSLLDKDVTYAVLTFGPDKPSREILGILYWVYFI